jgi:hypothetical protein
MKGGRKEGKKEGATVRGDLPLAVFALQEQRIWPIQRMTLHSNREEEGVTTTVTTQKILVRNQVGEARIKLSRIVVNTSAEQAK